MLLGVVHCFFKDIAVYLDIDKTAVSLCDNNCLTRLCNRSSSRLRPDHSVDVLNGIMYQNNLIDVGASQLARVQYTHFQGSSYPQLDQVYISNRLCNAVSNHVVRSVIFSNHCSLSVSCEGQQRRSPRIVWGFLKLHVALLRNIGFRECLSTCSQFASFLRIRLNLRSGIC